MDDLVLRLREIATDYSVQEGGYTDDGTILIEAANEIAYLRREIERLNLRLKIEAARV